MLLKNQTMQSEMKSHKSLEQDFLFKIFVLYHLLIVSIQKQEDETEQTLERKKVCVRGGSGWTLVV